MSFNKFCYSLCIITSEKVFYKIWFFSTDSLILWMGDKSKTNHGQRITSRDLRRNEIVVQCYLFSNHLVITTRASNGKLHLVKVRLIILLLKNNSIHINLGLWCYSLNWCYICWRYNNWSAIFIYSRSRWR
jgi:hypothetical protein